MKELIENRLATAKEEDAQLKNEYSQLTNALREYEVRLIASDAKVRELTELLNSLNDETTTDNDCNNEEVIEE